MENLVQQNEVSSDDKYGHFSYDKFTTLLEQSKLGNTKALGLLVDNYQNIIHWSINNLGRDLIAKLEYKNLETLCNEFLIDKLLKYKNPEGGNFAKYFIVSLKYHMISLRKEIIQNLKIQSYETPRFEEDDRALAETLADNNNNIYDELDSLFNKFEAKQIVDKVLPALPKIYREIIQKVFFENKTRAQAGIELKIHSATAGYRLKYALKYMRELMQGDINNLRPMDNANDLRQAKRLKHAYSIIDEAEKILDLEKEFVPQLNENQKYVFYRYIYEFDGTQTSKLAEEIGKYSDYMKASAKQILNKLVKVMERKKDINAFCEKYGGREFIEDVSVVYTNKQRTLLFDLMLSPTILNSEKVAKKMGVNKGGLSRYKQLLENQLSYNYLRKQMADDFIRLYGGEDFLVNVFGEGLSEEHFFVLVNYMMDCHYVSARDLSHAMGKNKDYVSKSEVYILKKLDKFCERKDYVDKLIEDAGGVDEVNEKITSKISEMYRNVLFSYTTAYNPINQDIIGKQNGVSRDTINTIHKKLLKMLDELAQQKQLG